MASVGITRIEESYYRRNGLKSFSIRLREAGGNYLSLANCRAELILFNSQSKQTYKWSSVGTTGENLLTLEASGQTGKITFPKIKSWSIPVGLHSGDLNIYDANGALTTYQTLEFNIVENFQMSD